MVRLAIEAAMDSKLLTRIVVNSDSHDVLEIAKEYSHVLAITRPEELSSDTSPAIDYVHHTLGVLNGMGEPAFDATVIIQASSPFTTGKDIDNTIRLLEESGCSSAVSVMKLDHAVQPAKLKIMKGNRLIPYLEEEGGRMAAHELPELYVRNCAVYATKMESIEQGKIITDDSAGYLMPRERSVDINDGFDLAFAEFLYSKKEND